MWTNRRPAVARKVVAGLAAAVLLASCGDGPHMLYGFIDDSGQWVIPPHYKDAMRPSEGLVPVQQGEQWGFVDSAGHVVIEPRFSKAKPFSEGLAAVESEDKWSFVDARGAVVIAGPFDDAHPFHQGLAAVQVGKRWGFVGHDGRFGIEPGLEQVDDQWEGDGPVFFRPCFSEGLCAASRDGNWGFIDRSGSWRVEPRFVAVQSFREGLAVACEKVAEDDERCGFVDRHGNWSLAPSYAGSLGFSGGRAIVVTKAGPQAHAAAGEPEAAPSEEHDRFMTTLIDASGRSLCDLGWPDDVAGAASEVLEVLAPDYLAEGMVPAVEGGRWGFRDRQCEWVIPPRFGLVFPFRNGLAPAADVGVDDSSLNWDKWGLIDRHGRWVVGPQLQTVGPYDGPYVPARLGTHWGLLDRDGQWRVKPRFVSASDWVELPGGMAVAGEGLYRVGVFANHRWSEFVPGRRKVQAVEYQWLERITPSISGDHRRPKRFAYLRNEFWGLADDKWRALTEAQFDKAPRWSGEDSLLEVTMGDRHGCIDATGAWIVPAEFEYIEGCNRLKVRARRGSDWGTWESGHGWRALPGGDSGESSVIGPNGVGIGIDSEWRATMAGFEFYRKGRLQKRVKPVDEVIARSVASSERHNTESLAIVRRGERWGAIDSKGHERLPVRFEAIGEGFNGLFAARADGRWSIVKTGGRVLFTSARAGIQPFSTGTAIFCEEQLCGLIDRNDAVVLAPTYSAIRPLTDGFAEAIMSHEDGARISAGIIDARGRVIVGQDYYEMFVFSPNLWLGWDAHGHYTLLDRSTGEPLMRLGRMSSRPGELSEDRAAVMLSQPGGESRMGYIDARGRVVIQPRYDYPGSGNSLQPQAARFSNGTAIVPRDGQCGVIDRRGRELLPTAYRHCSRLDGGRILYAEELPPAETGAADAAAATPPAPES